jgi:hypothetical protein
MKELLQQITECKNELQSLKSIVREFIHFFALNKD